MLYFINATSFFSTDEVSDSKFFNWKSMMINVLIDLYYIVIFVSDLLKNNDVPCVILYACFVLIHVHVPVLYPSCNGSIMYCDLLLLQWIIYLFSFYNFIFYVIIYYVFSICTKINLWQKSKNILCFKILC